MTTANPHILDLVEAAQALDKVLERAAGFEACQDRRGRASQVETLRLDISGRTATLLHNLTLGTSDHETYRIAGPRG